MDSKKLLAQVLNLDPNSRVAETYMNDSGVGKKVKSLLKEMASLQEKMDSITQEITRLCKTTLDEWSPVVENAIILETDGDEVAARMTRNRKHEIMEVVETAIGEGVGPSDIQTIIEVMVMGMQPGEAHYLPSDQDQAPQQDQTPQQDREIFEEEPSLLVEEKKQPEPNPDRDFLRTTF